MAHCPPAELADLADLLAEVRSWAGIVEKSPAVFYVRRQPFLHFHRARDGRRRGDIKGANGWLAFDLTRPVSTRKRAAFARALRTHFPTG